MPEGSVREPDWASLEHLVFDCDGVLWEGAHEGYFRCYHTAAVEAGIEIEFDLARRRILENWGKSAQQEIEGMIPEHPELIPEVLRRYSRLVRSDVFFSTASLVPGAGQALEELSRSYRLSVVTGMDADNLPRMLDRFGLRRYFRQMISTSETSDPEKQKPTGYHLRQLMQAENLAPARVLCVGDALSDVQMARSQGVAIVVVLTGHLTRQEATELGVTAVLPSVASLPEWIQERCRAA